MAEVKCWRRVVAWFLLLLAFSLPVPLEVSAQGRILATPNGTEVVIWRSSDAQSEGLKMINAGVHKTNPALLAPLVACFAPSGSKAIVTDGGFFSSTVTVVNGKASGCKGVVANDWLKK